MSEHFKFRGNPARVVIEVEMKNGTVRVPVHEDLFRYKPASDSHGCYGELTILVGQPLEQKLMLAHRETARDFGP